MRIRRAAGVLVIVAAALAVAAGCSKREGEKAAAEKAAARLERGRYLVENVLDCFACHSEVDWVSTGLPRPGSEGGGGQVYDYNLPLAIYAPNISPDPETGAGRWSDRTFRRALREGIGDEGEKLLVFMPHQMFRYLSDEDLEATVAYMRSIPPVNKKMPETELPPELRKALEELNMVVPPQPPASAPPQVRRGAYLATVAGCSFCHTGFHPATGWNPALAMAGGMDMHGPWGRVTSANITPDPSGISYYSEAMFLKTMRSGAVDGVRPLNHIMPWKRYRNMTDEDLKAIFAYLQTLPPVRHRVDNTEPPTPCTLCGNAHGFGDRNR